MNGNRFRQLNVYQSAKVLVKDVYALLKKFPLEEQYALCDQLRRAVISVPSNIAEGMGRAGDKDQAHFLEIAYGSLLETQCQLEIACDLGYITKEEFEKQDKDIESIGKMLSGLRSLRIANGERRVAKGSVANSLSPESSCPSPLASRL